MSAIDEETLREVVAQHGTARSAMHAATLDTNVDVLCALLDKYGGDVLIEEYTTDHNSRYHVRDCSTLLHTIARVQDKARISLLRAIIPYCKREWWTMVRETTYHEQRHLWPPSERELEEGLSPWEAAVCCKHALDIVPILINEAHVDVCATNQQREGVLFLLLDQVELARILVDAGADPYATNVDGFTVMEKLKEEYQQGRHGPHGPYYSSARLEKMFDAMGVDD